MMGVNLPKIVILEMTYSCNHSCIFCSAPWSAVADTYKRGRELNLKEWFAVIDRLAKHGVRQITFSGGEALLNDGLLDIIEYAHSQRNFQFGLITNGYNMSKTWLDVAKKYRMRVSMSMPGLTTFKTHTGVDNYENILGWFREANKMGITTTANITVTKRNLHELYETLAEVILAGASSVLINRFLAGGQGLRNMNELQLSIDEVNEMLDVAELVLGYGGIYGYTGTEIPLCVIKDRNKYKHLRIASKCGAARDFIAIDPAGYIRVCNHSTHRLGHILDDKIITNHMYWNKFIQRDFKPDYCKGCKDYNICDCGCREVANIITGDLRSVDPIINQLR